MPISAWAIPSRCCMPLDIASIAAVGRVLEADEPEELGSFRRAAVGAGEPLVEREQLVGARTSRGSGRARPGSRASARAARRRRGAVDLGASPPLGRTRPQAILTSVDLPAPFGAEQADELALADLEVDALRAPRRAPYRFSRPRTERAGAAAGAMRRVYGGPPCRSRLKCGTDASRLPRYARSGEEAGGPERAAALDRTRRDLSEDRATRPPRRNGAAGDAARDRAPQRLRPAGRYRGGARVPL